MTALDRAKFYSELTPKEAAALFWDWRFWARPEQIAPTALPNGEPWSIWLVLAGRGFGKTRLGAEWVRDNICGRTPMSGGKWRRIALVAETAADARDVMAEGPSGILAVHPPEFRPKYEPSKRRIVWPNGAVATLFSAEDPEQLRGPEHEAAWCDEVAKWRYAQETWDMLQFGMRLGDNPQQLVTTTPRPIPLVREIMADRGTVTTRGATYDNMANLAPKFIERMRNKYEGTRLGRQELRAEILDDVPGALWTRDMLDAARLRPDPVTGAPPSLPDMVRVVVAVDPSGSSGEDGSADDIGIVVGGLGTDGLAYVLADESCNEGPSGWAKRAVNAYKYHQADVIVAETNYGGAMVELTVRSVDRNVNFKMVSASRGKVVRATPVAALYEQGRVRHVGAFAAMEDQLCSFTNTGYLGSGSPDRADALVWLLTELLLGGDSKMGMLDYAKRVSASVASGVARPHLTLMRAPAGTSTVYFSTGEFRNVGVDGCALVPAADLEPLIRAGWVVVTDVENTPVS